YETATGGRVMMSYFVLMILLGPLAARWADRSNRHRSFVILGGVLSGTGVFSVLYWNDLWAVLAGVTALGLGQALLTAPTLALIPEISARECQRFGQATVLGALRVIERIGSVAGPLLAAWVLGQFGYAGSAASSGVIVIAGSVLLGLVLLALGDGRRTATARGLP
ncbi:MAG: MFS transporter, partial [Candidatus Competibacter sp.]|nr:MFS transporter [Candidatus Competibacter sp.]